MGQANRREPAGKTTLFRRPLSADWCVWLGVVGVVAGVAGTAQAHGVFFDYLFAVAF